MIIKIVNNILEVLINTLAMESVKFAKNVNFFFSPVSKMKCEYNTLQYVKEWYTCNLCTNWIQYYEYVDILSQNDYKGTE